MTPRSCWTSRNACTRTAATRSSGCTELSVVYQDLAVKPAYLIDAMDVLADRCVRYYLEHHRDA